MLHITASFHAVTGLPIRFLTRVIVRFCLTNLMLSVVLAQVRLNKQGGRERDVLIVQLIRLSNVCTCTSHKT
jgi:hypothetical protein